MEIIVIGLILIWVARSLKKKELDGINKEAYYAKANDDVSQPSNNRGNSAPIKSEAVIRRRQF